MVRDIQAMPDGAEHVILVRQYRPQLRRETLDQMIELVTGEFTHVNRHLMIMLAAGHMRRHGLTDAPTGVVD